MDYKLILYRLQDHEDKKLYFYRFFISYKSDGDYSEGLFDSWKEQLKKDLMYYPGEPEKVRVFLFSGINIMKELLSIKSEVFDECGGPIYFNTYLQKQAFLPGWNLSRKDENTKEVIKRVYRYIWRIVTIDKIKEKYGCSSPF